MRVMITGASGFVGSFAAEALVGAGHEPVVLARNPDKAAAVLAVRGLRAGDYDVVEGDMTDGAAVDVALDGAEGVVHAAAAVATTGADNDAVVAANVEGARTVLGRAVERGVTAAVYISTTAVFVPPSEPVIRADSPLALAHTPYGRSKVAAERYVRGLQSDGAPIVTIYPGGVYGPDQPAVGDATDGLRGCLETGFPQTAGGIAIVDVRDIAELVVAGVHARTSDRWMAGGRFFDWKAFADLGDTVTGEKNRRIPFPKPVIGGVAWVVDMIRRVVPLEYPLTRDAVRFMTAMVPTDDSHTLDVAGVTYRDPVDTLTDTVRWMVETGVVKPKAAGVLGRS